MKRMQLCPRLRPARAIGMLACLVATTSQVGAGLPLQPEQIVVTCFSGTINYYGSPPTVTPNLGNGGYVVAKFDTQPFDLCRFRDHAPVSAPGGVSARGQVASTAMVRAAVRSGGPSPLSIVISASA